MRSILVRDYMQHVSHAISIHSNTTEVVAQLLKNGLSGVPVIDDNGSVVGFISEQDCIKEILNDAFFCDNPTSVRDLMSTEVLTVEPTTSIIELAQRMILQKPKNYPVVSEGQLVGLITRRQVLQALVENKEGCYLRV